MYLRYAVNDGDGLGWLCRDSFCALLHVRDGRTKGDPVPLRLDPHVRRQAEVGIWSPFSVDKYACRPIDRIVRGEKQLGLHRGTSFHIRCQRRSSAQVDSWLDRRLGPRLALYLFGWQNYCRLLITVSLSCAMHGHRQPLRTSNFLFPG